MHASSISLSIRSYRGRERAHAHDFHQIVLPVVGSMEVRVGDRLGAIAARHGALIVGGTPHRGTVLGENRFVVFEVPRVAFLPESIVARAAGAPFFSIDEPLDHLVRYVSSEISAGALSDGLARHASALMAESVGRKYTSPLRTAPSILRALAMIEARYAEPLTASALAREAGMGLSRFHEEFRRETGDTPAERLAATRLDRAEELLCETVLSIAEIALAVGFSDQSALTRSFRRRRGTTPSVMRRGLR